MDQDRVDAKAAIDALTHSFFALFSNRDGVRPALEHVFDLFVPRGVITKCTGDAPEIATLEEFIAPRQTLLTDGTLTEFGEEEISERTEIFGNIAQRLSVYRKSGFLRGEAFSIRGKKNFQFVSTAEGWRILSVTWDDERAGLAIA